MSVCLVKLSLRVGEDASKIVYFWGVITSSTRLLVNLSSSFAFRCISLTTWFSLSFLSLLAQVPGRRMHWTADGNAYASVEQINLGQSNQSQGDLIGTDVRTGRKTILLSKEKLRRPGTEQAMAVTDFAFTPDSSSVLVFTNTARVWRYNTRGDYFLVNRSSGAMRQLGTG
ncbi:MAG: peptidase dipeptidylpeptidase protein, partial [Spirosoma sp.]|nr:peptidase dipeptidylpeptidase protein [Spirosoma sp.]